MGVKQTEDGISEVMAETLILLLVIACAAVTLMLVFGVLPVIHKTAYVVPQFGIKNVSGGSVIYVFDQGGDTMYFNTTTLAGYKVTLFVDTTAGSFTAVPVSGLNLFKPGDLVYLCYTGSGFIITPNLTGVSIIKLPAGQVTVRMVDASSGVLISQEIVVKGTTTTATATPTSTPTPTPTPTPVPASLAANFDWVEKGMGGAVHFTDTSTGSPTSWSWNICGSSSTARNPIKNIGKSASCSVALTVTRSSDGATSSITKTVTTV